MSTDKVKSLAGVVPELWHDLIARIVPGCIVLATLSIATDFRQLERLNTFVSVASGLLLAYVSGLILDLVAGTITDICAWIATKCAGIARWIRDRSPLSDERLDTWTVSFVPKVFLRSLTMSNYTTIDELDSPERDLLVKMFAEVTLLRSLFYYSVFLTFGSAISRYLIQNHISTNEVVLAFEFVSPLAAAAISSLLFVLWCRMNDETQKRFSSLIELKNANSKTTPAKTLKL